VYTSLNGRLKAVEKGKTDLRAIVGLELKALADGDAALFRTYQDPTDADWQARQIVRYLSPDAARLVPAPGLAPADRPAEIKQIHLSGPTGRAELVRWFQYPTGPSSGASELLPFQATWFYRLDDQAVWRHVAPPDGYWGAPYTWQGSQLIIRAAQAEANLLAPIADELADLIASACQLLDCRQGSRYILSFEDVLTPRALGHRWMLPALYLSGLPEDQAAAAAWAHAVKLWLVEALAQTQVADDDGTDRLIYRQLVAYLAAELELIEPISPDVEPLTQALLKSEPHPPATLWEARQAPRDLEGTRPPQFPPGDQIAFICDGRIWVGNADGSNLAAVTATGQQYAGLHWSPVHPDRLAFTWLMGGGQPSSSSGYLFDLDARFLYAASPIWGVASPALRSGASGSPDGAWLAFAGQDRVQIVDSEGQERFSLQAKGACSEVAWNPAADLSGLGGTE
jgi:hypothetical protein